MAQALRNNARTDAVLIADNGHVRRDIGVARWLSAFDVANIQAHGYIERGSVTEDFAYDTTHAIAPHKRPDLCGAIVVPSKATP